MAHCSGPQFTLRLFTDTTGIRPTYGANYSADGFLLHGVKRSVTIIAPVEMIAVSGALCRKGRARHCSASVAASSNADSSLGGSVDAKAVRGLCSVYRPTVLG